MRRSVMNLLGEAKTQMSGYVALLNYRYLNLCVKAEPAALLSVTVDADGEMLDIEKTAKARNAPNREDQFEIYPLDSNLLFPLSKGLKTAHPEFEIEIMSIDGSDDEEDKYLLVTMPVVNKERRDALMNAVSALSDECKVKVDGVFHQYMAQVVDKLVGAPADEIDEAKNELDQLHDDHNKLLKEYREDKGKEIEDAYQRYLTEQQQKDIRNKEEADARGEDKRTSMRLLADDNE